MELQQHIRDAVEACRKVHERGNIPIAPHLYWPRFLDDNDPQDRDYGIAAGLEKMVQGKELRCDRNADLEPDTPNGSDQEEGGWRNSIREGLHQRRNDPVQTSDDRG